MGDFDCAVFLAIDTAAFGSRVVLEAAMQYSRKPVAVDGPAGRAGGVPTQRATGHDQLTRVRSECVDEDSAATIGLVPRDRRVGQFNDTARVDGTAVARTATTGNGDIFQVERRPSGDLENAITNSGVSTGIDTRRPGTGTEDCQIPRDIQIAKVRLVCTAGQRQPIGSGTELNCVVRCSRIDGFAQ